MVILRLPQHRSLVNHLPHLTRLSNHTVHQHSSKPWLRPHKHLHALVSIASSYCLLDALSQSRTDRGQSGWRKACLVRLESLLSQQVYCKLHRIYSVYDLSIPTRKGCHHHDSTLYVYKTIHYRNPVVLCLYA